MWFSDSSILCKVLHVTCFVQHILYSVATLNGTAASSRRRQQQENRGGRFLLASRPAAATGVSRKLFLSNSSSYSTLRLALIMLVNSWTLLQNHNKVLKSFRELRLESYHEAANFKKINSIRVFVLSSDMFADIDSTKLTMAAAR